MLFKKPANFETRKYPGVRIRTMATWQCSKILINSNRSLRWIHFERRRFRDAVPFPRRLPIARVYLYGQRRETRVLASVKGGASDPPSAARSRAEMRVAELARPPKWGSLPRGVATLNLQHLSGRTRVWRMRWGPQPGRSTGPLKSEPEERGPKEKKVYPKREKGPKEE